MRCNKTASRRYKLAFTSLFMLLATACSSAESVSSTAATNTREPATAQHEKSTTKGKATKRKTTIVKEIPERTSAVVITDNGTFATKNADEPRPGLSVLKLYIADYALRKGEISQEDFALAKRMITSSDDFAADVLYHKYPESIDWVAQDYDLENTTSSTSWGAALTSAEDVAKYLNKVKKTRPNSFILKWMSDPQGIATDGTKQQWGTAQFPGEVGTKWGWSDFGKKSVASATYGKDFTAAAFTWGSDDTQDEDISVMMEKMED